MKIYINGVESHQQFASLADVVASVTNAQSGVAAAVNDSVVPKREWEQTVLTDGARVEIVTAVQGG